MFGPEAMASGSIRINDQWHVIVRWIERDAYNVQIIDYH